MAECLTEAFLAPRSIEDRAPLKLCRRAASFRARLDVLARSARTTALGFGWADFVGDGVASAFEGAPHVPAGDSAIRAPAFPECEKLLATRHVLFAVGDGPSFFHAEIVDRKNVGPAQTENQKHFDGPDADSADGDEALDQLFIGQIERFIVRGNDAGERFGGEIFQGKNFCAREASFAEGGLAELQDFFRSGDAAGGTECLDAGEDSGGGFAGNGLVDDGFEEGFVGILRGLHFGGEGTRFADELGEAVVNGTEVSGGDGEVEGED